ncbi:MAG: hypothetical protein CSA97_04460 [Bacteroidetes bacterium]|nr:MAG: hypothetical protein CSA97_04460 [Bacteroidota bacterium]
MAPTFIETFRIENGDCPLLTRHIERIRRTLAAHALEDSVSPFLASQVFPAFASCIKGRMVYSEEVHSLEYTVYAPREIRSLRLMEAPHITYPHKSTDRSPLSALLQRRDGADDILITRNGYITDTSFSNVVLTRGDELHTPSTYLLAGTRRAQLLAEGKILERQIHITDLADYSHILLVNAMLDLGDMPPIPIQSLIF